MQDYQEWEEAQGISTERNQTSIEDNVKWEPPPAGKLNVSIDAGWTGDYSTGFSMVARGHDKAFMVATTSLEPTRLDPTVAEALALRWALALVVEMGMDNIVFEADSLVVVNAKTKRTCRPDLAHILHDYYHLV
ncbi:uncharacterized protein LOC130746486 [Lotus japonicus]|uniref:uncharacterized protein LOC130746486 n=1 Tax=Lotus japonicus TaxID=34305 RepID=UPI002584FB4F|nr:uncharacterized protein LOC130746486 [Lotus japonicus]